MQDKLDIMLKKFTAMAIKNKTGNIYCPICQKNKTSKWGFYDRYLFGSQDMFKIQRYLCKNKHCLRRTFSVLPRTPN